MGPQLFCEVNTDQNTTKLNSYNRSQHTLVNAVTAKLCGATGEKSMFVIAPNSFIWTGACEERNKDALSRLKKRKKLKMHYSCSQYYSSIQ